MYVLYGRVVSAHNRECPSKDLRRAAYNIILYTINANRHDITYIILHFSRYPRRYAYTVKTNYTILLLLLLLLLWSTSNFTSDKHIFYVVDTKWYTHLHTFPYISRWVYLMAEHSFAKPTQHIPTSTITSILCRYSFVITLLVSDCSIYRLLYRTTYTRCAYSIIMVHAPLSAVSHPYYGFYEKAPVAVYHCTIPFLKRSSIIWYIYKNNI
jgi:hypothetical protein